MALGRSSFTFNPFQGRDMSVPTPGGGSTTATNPYGGFDPNTINIEPYQQIQSFIQEQAMDPNQALRDQMQENLREQVLATQQAYGLGAGEGTQGSGVGLQALGEAQGKFEADWQDRQLGRATQGAQAMFGAGQLMQDVARQGFQHQQMLGESAFENPIAGGSGGATVNYGGHTNLSQGRYGGVPALDRGGYRSTSNPYTDMMNAQALSGIMQRNQEQQFGRSLAGLQNMANRGQISSSQLANRAAALNNISPGGANMGVTRTYAQYVPGLTAAMGGTPQPIRELDYQGRKVYGPFLQDRQSSPPGGKFGPFRPNPMKYV